MVSGGAGSEGAVKEEEEEVSGRRKMETREMTDFFSRLWLLISPLQAMESTFILSSMVPNFSH